MEDVIKPSNIIGPLTFHSAERNVVLSSVEVFYPVCECACLLCGVSHALPQGQQALLTHLYMEHRLVIADAEQIASLRDYLEYWKQKLTCDNMPHYCSTMLLDKKPDGTFSKGEKYYLLSDIVPEDNQLRRDLQQKRLEKILAQQKSEREDKSYQRECLFCRTVVKDTRPNFLSHLSDKHNFHVAKAENLVFIEELIEFLANKLDTFVCIFCEKVFKDRAILKEHMRKKAHKRINPNNKDYDKYFISNYLEMGKNWQSYLKASQSKSKSKKSNTSSKAHSVTSKKSTSESDNDWSDWEEKDSVAIVCLFCKHSVAKYKDITLHMYSNHLFNFELLTKHLTFYDKIKIVNYIRRQMHLKRCISCDEEFQSEKELLTHMEESNHMKLENNRLWNQPEFFFSTYDDDGLLYSLEDNDSYDEDAPPQDIQECNMKSRSISEEVALSVLSD